MTTQEQEILELFETWNAALKTGDPKQVAALYEPDAVLLPTISDQVRHTPEEREDYFSQFLARKAHGKIDEANVRVFDDLAINSGLYTFTFKDSSKVQARFTFVYRRSGAKWMIVEHHSSQMPESFSL